MRGLFSVVFLAACSICVSAAENLSLELLDTYATGVFDGGGAEIGAFDPQTARLFVVNGDSGAIDVLDFSDPSQISLLFSIDLLAYGHQANSVAVKNGILAAAVEAEVKQDPGKLVFFNTQGIFIKQVPVGSLPDMVTFTPDGNKVLVANEGEPNDEVTVDPEGSISIVDISNGLNNATVTTAGFTQFNNRGLDSSIRVFTPGATLARDFEPEYITVAPDSSTAWVTCQENNALAVVDLVSGQVTSLIGLGFKNHMLAGNALDPSNRDAGVVIGNWPVFGMFLPDSIASFQVNGQTYLITANEGDSRDYSGFSEEERVKDLDLDPIAFPNAASLKQDANLGRLKVTNTLGDDDQDGDYDRLFAFGARSFSIWNSSTGALVYDSGDLIENLVASMDPDHFNSDNDSNDSFDSRSDDKGPEPEGLTIGQIGGRTYAFLGLERMGGIMIFDVSNPSSPVFIQYLNNRHWEVDPTTGDGGDLGPEGITFISAQDSPNHHPLLAVMNEVSGTTSVYQLNFDCDPGQILEVAPIGERGITISGSWDCSYRITLIHADGSVSTHYLTIDSSGLGFLDVLIEQDLVIQVSLGENPPTDQQVTVPTLGTWGLILFLTTLLATGLYMTRSRTA